MDRVDEHDRTGRAERAIVSFGHALEDLFGDHGDRMARDVSPIDLGQVGLDLAGGQALRREGEGHLVHSTPVRRFCRFLTIFGSKEPSRSRGTDISTGPTSVSTVLARVPLRELPPFFPAGSCLS